MNKSTLTPQPTDTAYWSMPTPQVMQQLRSSETGLSQTEAAERLQRVGRNLLETHGEFTPVKLFLAQFKSPIVLILLVATLVSAFVQDWTDAAIILVIVLASATLSFTQEYSANSAAAKLKEQIAHKTRVLRAGQETEILAEEVVPGDVLLLSAGSLIPADALMLEAKDFFVNQAVLTGETFPVEKTASTLPESASLSERTNMVFMGTSVRSGSAKAVVTETGPHTFFGKTAHRLTVRPPVSEFELGISKLGTLLTEVMVFLVAAIFIINVLYQKPPIDSLLFSIALGVGLTPQLLPAIININLSRGARAMAQHGVIVRRLSSIENLGSMDTLCTDKTGTITAGVVKLDHTYDPAGNESQTVSSLAWLNSHFQTGLVNPLDEAILAQATAPQASYTKADEIPYDFFRKRLSVVVELENKRSLVCKGAFENILQACTQQANAQGTAPLTPEDIAALETLYQQWSGEGYRVLGLATKAVEHRDCCYSRDDEAGMTFAGFLLFFDPPKPDVAATIERLRKLGVNVKIITGDNHLVAAHVATQIGLQDAAILTGNDLGQMSDEALWHQAERTDIFAEVDPAGKERIILALKKTNHVVGYMGDGINDSPSLHSADVGLSVENAVDVAKESADIVLLRQDLAALEKGIIEGRKTFANTLKYIFMAVSANFGNMFSVAGASLFLPFLPLLPKQILLINFLTDFPEMTIAGDNVDDVYINKPHRWDVSFIRRFMVVFGLLSSVFDYLTFALLIWVFHASETHFQTGWFIESVLSAMLVVFAVRTRLPFHRSKPSRLMIIMTVISALVVLALPYSPLAGLLGFAPLPAPLLALIFGIILLYFASTEVVKRWFYARAANRAD